MSPMIDDPLQFYGTTILKNGSKVDTFRAVKPADPIVELRVTGEIPADVQEETGMTTSGWYFYDETWSFVFGPYRDRREAEEKLCEYAKQL